MILILRPLHGRQCPYCFHNKRDPVNRNALDQRLTQPPYKSLSLLRAGVCRLLEEILI
jgi:hypothetical protein